MKIRCRIKLITTGRLHRINDLPAQILILCGSQDPRKKDARQIAIQRASRPPLKLKADADFAVFSLMTPVKASSSGFSILLLLFRAFPVSAPAGDFRSFETKIVWLSSRAFNDDFWRAPTKNSSCSEMIEWGNFTHWKKIPNLISRSSTWLQMTQILSLHSLCSAI